MNFEKVCKLMEKFESSGCVTFEYAEGDFSLKLKKAEGVKGSSQIPVYMPAAPQQTGAIPESAAPLKSEAEKIPVKTINSPIVGAFYAAPSPDSGPYVQVGSKVSKGDTVCMIEAMKMMSEVKADSDGIIDEILVENGAFVEYDQALFRIRE